MAPWLIYHVCELKAETRTSCLSGEQNGHDELVVGGLQGSRWQAPQDPIERGTRHHSVGENNGRLLPCSGRKPSKTREDARRCPTEGSRAETPGRPFLPGN